MYSHGYVQKQYSKKGVQKRALCKLAVKTWPEVFHKRVERVRERKQSKRVNARNTYHSIEGGEFSGVC